jgi:hypothetical protein
LAASLSHTRFGLFDVTSGRTRETLVAIFDCAGLALWDVTDPEDVRWMLERLGPTPFGHHVTDLLLQLAS